MRKKVHCRSLSSIHILYNQALVRGLSDSFDPPRWIGNVSLIGGSTRVLVPASPTWSTPSPPLNRLSIPLLHSVYRHDVCACPLSLGRMGKALEWSARDGSYADRCATVRCDSHRSYVPRGAARRPPMRSGEALAPPSERCSPFPRSRLVADAMADAMMI